MRKVVTDLLKKLSSSKPSTVLVDRLLPSNFLKCPFPLFFLSILTALFLFGCAGKKVKERSLPSAESFYRALCATPKAVTAIEGDIWIQTRSKGINGQFPAEVKWNREGPLLVTVNNPLGGREATVELKENQFVVYKIGAKGKTKPVRKGEGHWAGIPLRFANALFSGGVPCPTTFPQSMAWEKNTLVVRDSLQVFRYEVTQSEEQDWVSQFAWFPEPTDTPKISIEFKDPDSEFFFYPKRWVAKSDQGEVHVRWKVREDSHAPRK